VNAEALAFYALAAMVLVGGALVVYSRNLVHAAVSLVPTLLGVAGLYVLPLAELATAIQRPVVSEPLASAVAPIAGGASTAPM